MSARNTVNACTSMKALPAAGLPNIQVPTITIMSPIGAADPSAFDIW